ncbi:Uma2 family endonuclease [Candidatus Viridilinea mediisalina]|uniref:Putative restriction endonuclease domain-containing protein n=1 Tax=Candidatus Viridilinea mediisalina TaxID=2024553 RepID=A0A2A6RGW7_9CHLR|nr:Uma2 family endonuclease [Candidatus Viridilinea mediisalina]PDW02129.1 hypothetical protein CJ255_15560 [Candidatus Viridilinea mediisalina]
MTLDMRRENLRVSWEKDGEILLELDPIQGHWTEAQYLLVTDQTNRLLEYTDGYLEVLPLPTDQHQALLAWLFLAFKLCCEPLGGKVRFAPLRLLVCAGRYREPDILLLRDANDPRRQNRYWLGADLVAEIVSEDDPERDTKVKRADYALAQIPEYWIVNPLDQTITVLQLDGEHYVEHGVFQRGEQATSVLMPGFRVDVSELLDAE